MTSLASGVYFVLYFIALGLAIPLGNIPEATVVVSPDGNDSCSGNWSCPVGSLVRAVELLGAEGGTIVLMPGYYAINTDISPDPLIMVSNLSLAIVGQEGSVNTIIDLSGAHTTALFALNGNWTETIVFQGLTIVGNTLWQGIAVINQAFNFSMEDVRIYNSSTTGWNFSALITSVSNCEFANFTNPNIPLHDVTSLFSAPIVDNISAIDITIHNCSFHDNDFTAAVVVLPRIELINATATNVTLAITNTRMWNNTSTNPLVQAVFTFSYDRTHTSNTIFISQSQFEHNTGSSNASDRASSVLSVYAACTDLIVTSSAFIDNGYLGHNAYGAIALYLQIGSVRFVGCQFVNNTAVEGGGGVFEEYDGFAWQSVYDGCLFAENTAGVNLYGGGLGGALYAAAPQVTVTNCTFQRNVASDAGGGIAVSPFGNATVVGSNFIENYSEKYGAAIYAEGPLTAIASNFTENNGGAIGVLAFEHTPTMLWRIEQCWFINNTASLGGALFIAPNCEVTCLGCVLINNTAHNGGALWLAPFAAATLNGCVLAGNRLLTSAPLHGQAAVAYLSVASSLNAYNSALCAVAHSVSIFCEQLTTLTTNAALPMSLDVDGPCAVRYAPAAAPDNGHALPDTPISVNGAVCVDTAAATAAIAIRPPNNARGLSQLTVTVAFQFFSPNDPVVTPASGSERVPEGMVLGFILEPMDNADDDDDDDDDNDDDNKSSHRRGSYSAENTNPAMASSPVVQQGENAYTRLTISWNESSAETLLEHATPVLLNIFFNQSDSSVNESLVVGYTVTVVATPTTVYLKKTKAEINSGWLVVVTEQTREITITLRDQYGKEFEPLREEYSHLFVVVTGENTDNISISSMSHQDGGRYSLIFRPESSGKSTFYIQDTSLGQKHEILSVRVLALWGIVSGSVGIAVLIGVVVGVAVAVRRCHNAALRAALLKDYHAIGYNSFNGVGVVSEVGGESVVVIPADLEIEYKEIRIIEDRLAGGAQGNIAMGLWNSLRVVIKRYHASGAEVDLETFVKEAQLLRSLRHPNIVQLLGVCRSPLSIVMEFVPRGSLYAIIHSQRAASNIKGIRLVSMALDVARGMTFLHSKGVLHRDLKSPNLLVTEAWGVKIADFGLSRPAAANMTMNVGSPRWTAPEVFSLGITDAVSTVNAGEYTDKADVYSFGLCLWEMVEKKLPFDELRFSSQVIAAVKAGKRPAISQPADGTSGDLLVLIGECWNQDPRMRPSFVQITQRLEVLFDSMSSQEEPSTEYMVDP